MQKYVCNFQDKKIQYKIRIKHIQGLLYVRYKYMWLVINICEGKRERAIVVFIVRLVQNF